MKLIVLTLALLSIEIQANLAYIGGNKNGNLYNGP